MQILSIHLTDIKSHRDTELTFSSGINVLSGANGSGKSTVFEAIGYALFGVDARDFVSNVDRFIAIGSKRGRISVTFKSDDGREWQVSRTVGPASKWLLAERKGDTFEVEEHSGITETETRIAQLLGLLNGRSLSEQFKLVIGPFQNDFLGPFIIRQPTKRQEAFDEILGIDTWRKTYKGTASLLALVQEKVKILEVEVEGLEGVVAILPEKEAEFAATGAHVEAQQRVLAERSAALFDLEALLKDFESRQKSITTLATQIQLLDGRIRDGGEKIATQKQRVDEALHAFALVEASRSGKESFEQAEQQLSELRNMELMRRAIEQDIAKLEVKARLLSQALDHEEQEIAEVDREQALEDRLIGQTREDILLNSASFTAAELLQERRNAADRLRAERSLLEGRRIALVEGEDTLAEGICPFFQEQCLNVAGLAPADHFSMKIGDLDRAIADFDRRIGDAARKVAEADDAEKEQHANRVRLQELDRRAAALEEGRRRNHERFERLETSREEHSRVAAEAALRQNDLQQFSSLDAEIERCEGERKRFQADRDTYTAQLKDALDLDNRRQTLGLWERGLRDLQQELAAFTDELAELRLHYEAAKHQELHAAKEQLLIDVATSRQQIEESGRTLERLGKEIDELKKHQLVIAEKRVLIGTFQEKERLVRFLRNQVFRSVSAQLSDRFREEITLHADRIYRTIAESDEELCWGDNYQIILRDMDAGVLRERSDDQLSGGQTMSAVVALRLALLQTIGARVAFFDEPTSNLDLSRRENLAKAFRAIEVGREEVTEHWYDQLFLISHDVAFTEITNQMIPIGE
ncbi:AAA family ATPase [Chlorobium sp. KB01]|uniref:AAA family ATPase n=1 Tax=Chlorobium sp. KB01 TaxID=1917528 RepID=UPI0009788A00|nr:SMC family ATPase [Chlorobium sp. KB01]